MTGEAKPLAIVFCPGAALPRRRLSRRHDCSGQGPPGNTRRRNALGDRRPCDVADANALQAALDNLAGRFGPPKVAVHNAVGGAFGTFADIDPEILRRNFEINVMALLHLARHVAPKMIAAGGGALIATGNTSALRGRQNFAGFAPTKAAQRILAESIARDLGPQGIHVAYLVIDAVIDVPWARARYKDAPDDFFIKPSAIADEVWHIAHQDRSAWSFLSEVRPYREVW
jgi:NAD(P)-dependent dehydrogenase (short-subunit alcohol dehydrogenase family)